MRRPIARDINQRKRVPGSSVSAWTKFNPMLLQPFLWLDAADTSTITESSGAVSQWNDKSGNGRHFTQASGTAQPTTGTTTQNGLNVIVFDGSSDFLRRTETFNASRFFTFAYVATPSSGTDDYHMALQRTVGQWSLITKYLSRAYEFYQFSAGTARFTLGAANATGYNTNIIIHSETSVTSLVNGVPSNSSTSGSSTDQGFVDMFVGSGTSTGYFAGCNIAEILLFNQALNGGRLRLLSDYLRQKWATP